MSHFILPPSSAGIWGKKNGCTGSVKMAQKHPQKTVNPEARIGDASHEIGQFLIKKAQLYCFDIDWSELDGQHAQNDELYSKVMFDGAKIYADNVIDIMRKTNVFTGDHIGVEQRVYIDRVYKGQYGTPDFWLYDAKTNTLYIWDYKFGFGIVEVFENDQMINYVVGIFDYLKIDGLMEQSLTVHFRLIQPRGFHRKGAIREWIVKATDLRGHFNRLYIKAAKAMGNDAELHTGSHCRHCSARLNCAPALKAGMDLYELSGKVKSQELSLEALSVQYTIIKRAIKQLEYLEIAFDSQIKTLIRQGKMINGYGVEPTTGNQVWNKPVKEVVSMGDLLGFNLRNEKAITPKQALKLGVDTNVIKEYSNTPHTGYKIVTDDINNAREIFSK